MQGYSHFDDGISGFLIVKILEAKGSILEAKGSILEATVSNLGRETSYSDGGVSCVLSVLLGK